MLDDGILVVMLTVGLSSDRGFGLGMYSGMSLLSIAFGVVNEGSLVRRGPSSMALSWGDTVSSSSILQQLPK